MSSIRPLPKPLDSRLPAPGAWLERVYRGNMITMKVRMDGIEFEGRVYRTLTALRGHDPQSSDRQRTQGMPASFNQTMVYLALTQIHDAEKTYSDRYARGLSATLGQLGPPPSWSGPGPEHAGLFDPMHDSRGLADGAVTYLSQGYRVT